MACSPFGLLLLLFVVCSDRFLNVTQYFFRHPGGGQPQIHNFTVVVIAGNA
jgi:hypothetical protein